MVPLTHPRVPASTTEEFKSLGLASTNLSRASPKAGNCCTAPWIPCTGCPGSWPIH
jgi:hypothetical protein